MIKLTNPTTGDWIEIRILTDEPSRHIEGVGNCGYYIWEARHTTRTDIPHRPRPCYLWGPMDAFDYCRFLQDNASAFSDRVRIWGWVREVVED